jgi:hypothetical protein
VIIIGRAPGVTTAYSETTAEVVNLPILLLAVSVNQTLPSMPLLTPVGWEAAVSAEYSLEANGVIVGPGEGEPLVIGVGLPQALRIAAVIAPANKPSVRFKD